MDRAISTPEGDGPEPRSAWLAREVGQALRRTRLSVATMESCTGGILASLLTGSQRSGYFLGGAVAYDTEAKVKLGVPRDIIEEHGLVSSETALAMARAASGLFGASFGLGTTGVAGPEPLEGVAPGLVFVAVAGGGEDEWRELCFRAPAAQVKRLAAHGALCLLGDRVLLPGKLSRAALLSQTA